MRYSVYKFINEIGSSLLEATNYVKNNRNSINVLNDCADAILAIKETLDNYPNDIDELVYKNIEEFINSLEALIEKINNSENYDSELNNICNLSENIKVLLKNNIKYKFKIVFFAELGAKWDSMDSVYWAYKNREDCEVAVVLAPIFRAIKLPNGEIRSDVIYEDYLTPMGIEHIPFKQYDIKKDLPDIVFTSQPYESVTTEQFWAENIAPYTRLVYLPYFTSSDVIEDEQKFVQCQMPIHKLAWKVVCQSEKVKEVYSKYFENGGSNLIATGLPKWDYVVNMDKRDIKMPKEWEKLKGKKVIFKNFHYTTAIDSIINRTLSELKDAKAQGIGYIYRFHPMLETIVKVYNPKDISKLEEFKKNIKASDDAVIDENKSYLYSFKFSDAFLTSPTSLIWQYLITKKPIMCSLWNSVEDRKQYENSQQTFLHYTNLITINDLEDKNLAINKLSNNEDNNLEKRMDILNVNFPNLDGKIGERLSDLLINEILQDTNKEGL